MLYNLICFVQLYFKYLKCFSSIWDYLNSLLLGECIAYNFLIPFWRNHIQRVEILPIWNSVHVYAGASDTFFHVLRQLATAVVKSCPKRRHSSPTKYETVPRVYFSFCTSEKNKAYQFSTIAVPSLFSCLFSSRK